MRKSCFQEILFTLLLILIFYVGIWLIGSMPLTSKDFPLSEKWTANLQGSIRQLAITDGNTLIVRTITKIYALDVNSGKVLWQRDTARHLSYQPVLAKDGRLYLVDGKGLMALNQSDGKILWQQPIRYPLSGDVLDVTTDLIAVEDSPFLSVFQAADGSLLWEKDVCRGQFQAYFFDASIVVPCYGLRVIDARSGEAIWEMKSPPDVYKIRKSAYADKVVYSSQDLKTITAYDCKSKKSLWKTPLVNDTPQDFKVVGDYLFVAKENQLCILQRDNGRIFWCVDNLIKAKNPVSFGNFVYLFNGLRNGITAYDIRDGKDVGRLDFPVYNFITVEGDMQFMVPSDKLLIFAVRNRIFAYGQ